MYCVLLPKTPKLRSPSRNVHAVCAQGERWDDAGPIQHRTPSEGHVPAAQAGTYRRHLTHGVCQWSLLTTEQGWEMKARLQRRQETDDQCQIQGT